MDSAIAAAMIQRPPDQESAGEQPVTTAPMVRRCRLTL